MAKVAAAAANAIANNFAQEAAIRQEAEVALAKLGRQGPDDRPGQALPGPLRPDRQAEGVRAVSVRLREERVESLSLAIAKAIVESGVEVIDKGCAVRRIAARIGASLGGDSGPSTVPSAPGSRPCRGRCPRAAASGKSSTASTPKSSPAAADPPCR